MIFLVQFGINKLVNFSRHDFLVLKEFPFAYLSKLYSTLLLLNFSCDSINQG